MSAHALCLFGGGLDSRLAAGLITAQGVRVSCAHFETGFVKDERRAIVQSALEQGSGMALQVVDAARDYLDEVVLEPRFGYGAAMNPCIDCRIFMLRRAAEIADRMGCDFLVTGEVVGQRSMEQSRSALLRIEQEAGVEDRVLRPLSARLLPETEMEQRGSIDRGRLGKLQGRTRRGQLELARELGLPAEPTPSGGCCWLADRNFARRLRDELAHREGDRPDAEAVELLKRGRHFRLTWKVKVVIGRNEAESAWLAERAADRWVCQVADGRGALGIVVGDPDQAILADVAALAARYCRRREAAEVEVSLRRAADRTYLTVAPATPEQVERYRI
jgi:tRNA U34 2-thiouridine synthase MnmA/TrmU